MTHPEDTPISESIPYSVRRWAYRLLTTVLSLNLIFEWFDGSVASKIIETAAVFGFGVASHYTPRDRP